MPLYDYFCPQCHSTFETRRSFADAEQPADCPQCGSGETKRMISNVVAFVNDGTGARRVVAGPSCAGCAPVAGCGGCSVRR